MDSKFLNFYNKELAFVRRLGADFAEQYPKIAGNLRMSKDAVEDPHVARLIEAVAFLNAGVREQLDDDYSNLTTALLNILYPHYLAPIPSMAVVQLHANASETTKETIKKGKLLETRPIQDEPIRFQTCYKTDVWPLTITQAKLYGHTQSAPTLNTGFSASSVMHFQLHVLKSGLNMAEISPDTLRFFVKGTPQHVHAIYEMLLRDTQQIALATSEKDDNPIILDASNIQSVGFEADQGLLPYSSRSNIAHRLLSEFFTFPDKFLFFDITGLNKHDLSAYEDSLNIYCYLNSSNKDLEQHTSADNFSLNCTPIVNLFPKTAEPINWDHTATEHRVIPDYDRQISHEIYSVDTVHSIDANGNAHEFLPFYGLKHEHGNDQQQYWLAKRTSSSNYADNNYQGSDMELSLIDLDMKPSEMDSWVISTKTTCLNRDVPNYLPFGDGEPYLEFTEGANISGITCLTAPTATHRPQLDGNTQWRLLAHLGMNHSNFSDAENAADNLREMLRLYNFNDNEETRLLIDAILTVSTKKVVARDPSGHINTFCQGLEITVELDEEKLVGQSSYLFSSILERFFALSCSINSFTKLKTVNKGQRKVISQWQARNGTQALV